VKRSQILVCFGKGEFQNGTMSGRGKYQWTSGTIYDGTFVNNEINGAGFYKWLIDA
jgi:hypothetical protein